MFAFQVSVKPAKSFETAQYPYIAAILTSESETHPASLSFEAEITCLTDTNHQYIKENEPATLYFQLEDEAYSLRKGDIIVFKNRMKEIQNNGNPEAFDYKQYMADKGFSYSQYLGCNQWKKIGKDKRFSLKSAAIDARRSCLNKLDNLNLEYEQKSLISSLLLGYRQNLTPDQKSYFRESGLSHILAVSGLHTGILFFLSYLLFYPLRWVRASKLQALCMLTVIWGYAFLTGLSPSVVRACIMVSFILGGEILNRPNSAANSLLAAAFFMLLYQPRYLFDAGFQLSFLAVLSIFLFYPLLKQFYMPTNRIARYFWTIALTSIAVQIGLAPLVIYYFHQLPILALMANLVVIPLLPLILGGGIVLIALESLQISSGWLLMVEKWLLDVVNQTSQTLSSWSFASVSHIWISPLTTCICFTATVLLYLCFRTKNIRYFIVSLVIVTAGLTISAYNLYFPPFRSLIMVYNQKGNTCINIIDNRHNLIISNDTLITIKEIEAAAGDFWMKHNLHPAQIITTPACLSNLEIELPFVRFYNKTLLLLDSDMWDGYTTPRPLHIHYGIVGNGFRGKLEDIATLFHFDELIITAGVHPQTSLRLQRECKKLHIRHYVVKESGARQIKLY